MSIREKLAAAAGGVSLLGLAACATPPASTVSTSPSGAIYTTPITDMPGDCVLTTDRRGTLQGTFGVQTEGSWREKCGYSNNPRTRQGVLDVAVDNMRDVTQTVKSADRLIATISGFGR